MRIPAQLDLSAWRNAGFEVAIAFTENGGPLDLTGATSILMQVRVQPGQTGTPLAVASLSSGLVVNDATGGLIKIVIISSVLNAIATPDPFNPLKLFYDIQINPAAGQPFIAAQGSFILSAGVTR